MAYLHAQGRQMAEFVLLFECLNHFIHTLEGLKRNLSFHIDYCLGWVLYRLINLTILHGNLILSAFFSVLALLSRDSFKHSFKILGLLSCLLLVFGVSLILQFLFLEHLVDLIYSIRETTILHLIHIKYLLSLHLEVAHGLPHLVAEQFGGTVFSQIFVSDYAVQLMSKVHELLDLLPSVYVGLSSRCKSFNNEEAHHGDMY